MSGDADSPFWWHEATEDGVRVAFTSVQAGNLARHAGDQTTVSVHRRALESRMGVAAGSLRFLNQVHSPDVADAASCAEPPTADAWVSPQAAEPLAILVADCLPVLFAARGDDGRLLSGGAHAGRPGLLAGVLENTVAALRARGAAAITAWIGPGACGRCYEIPAEMVDAVAADRPAIRSVTSWGTPALDLRAEAAHVLDAAGAAVVDVPGCTIEDRDLFSHRGSQQTGAPEGRLAGLVWRA